MEQKNRAKYLRSLQSPEEIEAEERRLMPLPSGPGGLYTAEDFARTPIGQVQHSIMNPDEGEELDNIYSRAFDKAEAGDPKKYPYPHQYAFDTINAHPIMKRVRSRLAPGTDARIVATGSGEGAWKIEISPTVVQSKTAAYCGSPNEGGPKMDTPLLNEIRKMASMPGWAMGAITGAIPGAAVGALADPEKRWRGALIGGGIGAAGGGLFGAHVDREHMGLVNQTRALRDSGQELLEGVRRL